MSDDGGGEGARSGVAGMNRRRVAEGAVMTGRCGHGLTMRECYVCASPKYGSQTRDADWYMATIWPLLPIPGEFDAMDACDQSRWRSVVRLAIEHTLTGERARDVD